VSFDENLKRTLDRDFSTNNSDADSIDDFSNRHQARYVDGQKLYLAEANPESNVDILIDNEDFRHPVILRAHEPTG
jgi:hypothetical protein